jgi:hypothetical protein
MGQELMMSLIDIFESRHSVITKAWDIKMISDIKVNKI